MTLIARFALGVVVAALVILAATNNLFSPSPLVIGAQVFSVCLAVWARRSFQNGAFRVTATPGAPGRPPERARSRTAFWPESSQYAAA